MKDDCLLGKVARLAVVLLLTVVGATAESVFNGSAGLNWHNPTNWTPQGVPGSNDSVRITGSNPEIYEPVAVSNLSLSGSGRLYLTSNLTVLATLNMTNGRIVGPGQLMINAGAVMNLVGTEAKTLGCLVTNRGTIIWKSGQIDMSGGSLFNHGLIDIQGDSTVTGNNSFTSSLVNTPGAILRKSAGNGITRFLAGAIKFTNWSIVEIQSGTLNLQNTIAENGSAFTGAGLLLLDGGGGSLNVKGTNRLMCNTRVIGCSISGIGTLENNATLELMGGNFTGTGVLVNNSNALINCTSNLVTFLQSQIINSGVINILSNGTLNAGFNAKLHNNGLLNIQGGGFTNAFDSRLFFNNNASGILRMTAAGAVSSLGSLTVFTNAGVIEMTGGLLVLPDNSWLAPTGQIRFIITGSTPATGFGQLSIGSAKVGGEARLILTNGFVPAVGTIFDLMPGASNNGGFSAVLGQNIGSGRFLSISSLPLTLTVTESTPTLAASALAFANGQFQLQLGGSRGGTYVLQGSANLADWINLSTNTLSEGIFNFTDLSAGNYSNRFYRAAFVP